MTVVGITADVQTLEEFPQWKRMLAGITEFKAAPVLIDREQQASVRQWLSRIDALILSGGGDVAPQRYGRADAAGLVENVSIARDQFEESLYLSAVRAGIPVLAICRGLQLVNVIHGGTLAVDLSQLGLSRSTHQPGLELLAEPQHTASVDAGSFLAEILAGLPLSDISVNSQHHQGVDVLGHGLTRSGIAFDDSTEALELVIEGIPRVVGVQWHPEVDWPTNQHSFRLLETLVHSARARSADPDNVRGWSVQRLVGSGDHRNPVNRNELISRIGSIER